MGKRMEYTPTDYFLMRIYRKNMSNNAARNLLRQNPWLKPVVPYEGMEDWKIFETYFAEFNIEQPPDYVSSVVLDKIKLYYAARNKSFELFAKYKKAQDDLRLANMHNDGSKSNNLVRADEAYGRHEIEVLRPATAAALEALRNSNNGTLGPRNMTTYGLAMQNNDRAAAAVGPFSPRHAAVAPAAAAAALPPNVRGAAAQPASFREILAARRAVVNRNDREAANARGVENLKRAAHMALPGARPLTPEEQYFLRAKLQLEHLGRPPTEEELAAEIKKVKRFNAMQLEKTKRRGGKSRKSRKNRKTRRT